MSSAPLSVAASSASARRRETSAAAAATSRSRVAASGEDSCGIPATTGSRLNRRSSKTTTPRSRGRIPQQRQQQQQTPDLIRGVLFKRRDHLSFSAWRPRLFLLDRRMGVISYYLLDGDVPTAELSSPVRCGDAGPAEATGTTNSMQSPDSTTVGRGRRTPGTPGGVRDSSSRRSGRAMTMMATSSPLQSPTRHLDVNDVHYDVTPRGVLHIRGCIVRPVDEGRIVATPGRAGPRGNNGSGSNNGDDRLYVMVITPPSSRRHDQQSDGVSATLLKNDVYLAASTRSDRHSWLRCLSEACGMAVSPVPGGLQMGGELVATGSVRNTGSSDRVDLDADAMDGDRGDTGGVMERQSNTKINDDDDDDGRKENDMAITISTPLTNKSSTSNININETGINNIQNSTSQCSDQQHNVLNSPLRAASRRIIFADTPAAKAVAPSESEAGSSTSRSTAVPFTFWPPAAKASSSLWVSTAILMIPSIVLRTMRLVAPFGVFASTLLQLLIFLLLIRWSIRTIILRQILGRHLTVQPGCLHGPVTCNISCDLRGVLRFLGEMREERPAISSGGASINITTIVAKAISTSISELAPELNCHRVDSRVLGLNGWWQRRNDGDVGVCIVSSTNQYVSIIEKASSLSVLQIADSLWHKQCQSRTAALSVASSGKKDFGSYFQEAISAAVQDFTQMIYGSGSCCMIYTSPDEENNEVDITVAPMAPGGMSTPPTSVVIGGVRVVERDPRNVSQSQSRRPMLSISITIDCPACSVSKCRKVAERVQTLVQYPEMCE